MAELVPDEMLGVPGLAFLQHHMTRHLQLKVRFGLWDEILATPAPPKSLEHARGMWRYARGRALVGTGDRAAAEAELARVRAAAADPDLVGLRLEFNTSGGVLAIAADVLAGHITDAAGDEDAAIEHLWRAVHAEDELVYGEPPDWTVPVRHELGPILLTAGRPAEAERAFREDLERFPENGWSLHGLALALRAQGRDEEAEAVAERFRTVWSTADVQLSAWDR